MRESFCFFFLPFLFQVFFDRKNFCFLFLPFSFQVFFEKDYFCFFFLPFSFQVFFERERELLFFLPSFLVSSFFREGERAFVFSSFLSRFKQRFLYLQYDGKGLRTCGIARACGSLPRKWRATGITILLSASYRLFITKKSPQTYSHHKEHSLQHKPQRKKKTYSLLFYWLLLY